MKKLLLVFLVTAIALGLMACGGVQQVSVQRVDQLMLDGGSSTRFAAMVVNESVQTVKRDSSKTVLECYVTEGQEVKAGDKLFTYDSQSLELELEKQQLELEKLQKELETYGEQLKKLERELANTGSESGKTQLTLEINTLKTTKLEAEYTIKAKQNTVADIQQTLDNVDVLSPADGIIRKIDEEDGAQAYITIQESGAFRLKGTINEMNMSALTVGTPIRAISRVDSSQYWLGTVSSIDTEEASQNHTDPWNSMGVAEVMMTSSGYVFYADLESTDGLLLGQHVYVEAYAGGREGLWIPETFLADMDFDEETGSMRANVWAAGNSGLEKRSVDLGMYDDVSGCFEILSGLTGEDFLADPADPGCKAGAAVTYRQASDFSGQTEG